MYFSFSVVIGTSLSLKNPKSSFVTKPINVTINPYDEYHAFIMANNTSPGRFIHMEFGLYDSLRGQPLIIVNNKNLNFTYEILSREACDVHVTLLAITFDEVTYNEFLARASRMMVNDSGYPLIRVCFVYDGTHSVTSYIELTGPSPTFTSTMISPTSTVKVVPTTSLIQNNPTCTSAFTNSLSTITPTSTSTIPPGAAVKNTCYVTTIALSLLFLFICVSLLLC